MTSITVAVVGDTTVAAELGKRGTQSDLTLYNQVRDGHQATIVTPTHYPEKFPPLLSALAMADRVVFVVPGLTREVAEVAATLDVVAPPLELRLASGVGEEEVRRALKGSSLERAPVAALQVPALRQEIDGWVAVDRPGPVRVRIDHAFPVKGVGAVALGLVRQGVVKAHDSLRLFPTDRTVEVRSLQVHDVDVREAAAGSRVGLALKGVEADELSRGQVLAPADALRSSERLELGDVSLSRYYRGRPAAGASLHVQAGLQFAPVKAERWEGGAATLVADRPLAFEAGDPIVLADLSPAAGPRIVGRGTAR